MKKFLKKAINFEKDMNRNKSKFEANFWVFGKWFITLCFPYVITQIEFQKLVFGHIVIFVFLGITVLFCVFFALLDLYKIYLFLNNKTT